MATPSRTLRATEHASRPAHRATAAATVALMQPVTCLIAAGLVAALPIGAGRAARPGQPPDGGAWLRR
jgi:hypothetical protein